MSEPSAGEKANEPVIPNSAARASMELEAGPTGGLPAPSRRRTILKLTIFVLIVAIVAVVAWNYRDQFTLARLIGYKQQIDRLRQGQPLLVYGGAFLLYVVVTALSLPVAAPLTMFYGAVFGFPPTLIVVSFASTSGATIAFLSSRYLLRDSVQQKFGQHLQRFNQAWEQDGAFYLFTLRLIPYVPFWVVNLVMGLTPIRLRTFWWVSQLGMLPGTCAYVYAGTQLDPENFAQPSIPWQLFVAFAILGLLPLVLKKTVQVIGRRGRKQPQ